MKINLSDHQTKQIDRALKEETKLENQNLIEEIGLLQRQMLGEGKHSLLIVLQGMDASGKDGAVRRTFTGVNPNGISVKSFKKPTEEEYAHDFLWRVHKHLPAKGMIQIFNRSHYEDILVPSVYGYLSEDTIKERYNHINNFEKLVESNGTKILKFFLHVSKEEQYERLMERVELKEKHWKHNDGDWDTREHWDDFESVYERIFEKCNSPEWHIVPSDRNWEKVNYIAKVVLAELKKMKITWPALVTEKFK